MDGFWHWLLAWLCFWSADPAIIEAERARAAGLANVAYAAMAREKPAPKADTTPCRDGKCPPGASLAPVLPSVPAGRR